MLSSQNEQLLKKHKNNTMELISGKELQNGKYRIIDLLGQGGFGITYLAQQVSLGRKVAIKEFFMKEHCNRDETSSFVSVPSMGSRDLVEHFKQKFLKEARTIASFTSSSIVNVFDVFEENGTAYYVMEYLEGDSLKAIIDREGAIPEETAVKYIRQIGSALSEIHSKKLVHLDIKPANIMLNFKGEAVLIDFGISKHYDETGSQTSSGLVGLSEGYAPMEQYKKGGLTSFSPATDIYSLGATLFKLLTGQTPPHASDVNDDGLPALPQHLSANVRAAIEASMQPRRKDRPQSIAEFLEIVESGKVRDERGEMKDDSDGVEDCPPVLRGTSAAEGVNDSSATDDGETVVGNSSGSCHPERSEPSVDARRGQSQGSYKHANREILPPSGRQNDNSGKWRDERKGLGGTSKKRWAIVVAILVIIGAGAMFMLGGGSNNYEGKLVPILDNSNDKWGYADTLGNIVIEPQYDGAARFSEGLAEVEKDDKYGFIDKTGKVVIEPQYDAAGYFSDGLAVVKKDDKYGFIDKTGKVVVEPKYDNVTHFHEGLAWVRKDGKRGFIDKTGKVVVELQYDDAWDFSEGLALVIKDDRRGFIDKTGRVVVEPKYYDTWDFKDGLAAVRKDGKWGFIDKTGKVVVEPKYDYAYSFSEGLANVEKDGKYGFIDKTGKVAVELQYDDASPFYEGLALVEKDGKEGFIDKTGKVVVEPQYDAEGYFSEGMAMVVKDYKCGFIDKTGRVVIEPQYDDAWGFYEGLALVRKDGKEFYIDKTGREYIKW